jgi:predicted nuclease of restriction endonuclease-like (RecB) superfamily
VLLDKLKSNEERAWYSQLTIQNGWSRNVLVHQIESDLFHRQGRAITNFKRTLPAPQSELAQQLVKDPYNFDFLSLGPQARERDIERGLIERILCSHEGEPDTEFEQEFLEMLEVAGEDFRLDLLFYHLRLRCFIVIDLKIDDFRPEYAGKMNFYLSAVDDLLKHPDDQPSIGIILCKTKNSVIVEYTLRDTSKPLGVAEYRITAALPEKLRGSLPSIEDLEEELGGEAAEEEG